MSETLTPSEIDEKLRQEESERSPGWAVRAVMLRKSREEIVRAAERVRKEGTQSADVLELRRWFEENAVEKLKPYVEILIDNGFDDLAGFADITMDDLASLEITRGHSKELVRLALKAKVGSTTPSVAVVGERVCPNTHVRPLELVLQNEDDVDEPEGMKEFKSDARRWFAANAPEELKPHVDKLIGHELSKFYTEVIDLNITSDRTAQLKFAFRLATTQTRFTRAFRKWFAENAESVGTTRVDKLINDWNAKLEKLAFRICSFERQNQRIDNCRMQ